MLIKNKVYLIDTGLLTICISSSLGIPAPAFLTIILISGGIRLYIGYRVHDSDISLVIR